MTDELPTNDTWYKRELPVLRAVAQLLEARDPLDDYHRPLIDTAAIAAAAGMDQGGAFRALRRLGVHHVEIVEAGGYDQPELLVERLLPAGLEAIGQWPTAQQATDRLLAAIDRLVDASPTDSNERTALVKLRDGVVSAGRDVLVNVVSAAFTGALFR